MTDATDAYTARIDTLPYRVVGFGMSGKWMVTNAPRAVQLEVDRAVAGPFATKADAQVDADRRNALDEVRRNEVLRRMLATSSTAKGVETSET